MSAHHIQTDPVLTALRELGTKDVSDARAQRLRAQCHREFSRRQRRRTLPSAPTSGVWIRVTGALAGAWSVVYFLETIRRTAAVFGF